MTKSLRNEKAYHFSTFYRFTDIADPQNLRQNLQKLGDDLGIIGIILIAAEGLNSTIAGDKSAIDSFLGHLRELPGFNDLEVKSSRAVLKRRPFRKLKVRVKREIVTMGLDDIDAANDAGVRVEPEQWDQLIRDPDVLVIDTRNVYEYRLGTFEGAEDPRTLNFRQFPEAVRGMLEKSGHKKVAMFCTGGIRCEKATAYVRRLGVDEVYHLHGGILNYLEKIPKERSSWNGACFVFDGRITVNHSLQPEARPLCTVCGQVMTRDSDESDYQCHQCMEFPMVK
jgi:UPF0176 protein